MLARIDGNSSLEVRLTQVAFIEDDARAWSPSAAQQERDLRHLGHERRLLSLRAFDAREMFRLRVRREGTGCFNILAIPHEGARDLARLRIALGKTVKDADFCSVELIALKELGAG